MPEVYRTIQGPTMGGDDREWFAERQRLARLERRKSCGIPDEYLDAKMGLHSFPPNAAHSAIPRWLTGEDCTLAICGPVGVGKTHIAMSAAAMAFTRHRTRFVSKVALSHELMDSAGMDEMDALRPYVLADRLVIDDLDKGHFSAIVVRNLWELFDARWRTKRPTLVTMNRNLAELFTLLRDATGDSVTSESLVDRLQQGSVVTIAGKSWRRVVGT